MRYPKDQKQATRQRILQAAGRRFKQDGIDGAGVAAVMSDAGLTNGAFYAHFTSKEDPAGQASPTHHPPKPQTPAPNPQNRPGPKGSTPPTLPPNPPAQT